MASFADVVRDAAKQSFCDALGQSQEFNNELGKLTGYKPVIDGPAALRGAYCNRPEPGPKPQAPFQGGQCDGSNYSITATLNARGVPNGPDLAFPLQTFAVGPISNISGETLPEGSSTIARAFVVDKNGKRYFGGSSNSTFVSLTGITVTRFGGLPDDCGNPPAPDPPFPEDGYVPQLPPGVYLNDTGQEVQVQPTAKVRKPILRPDGGISVNIEVNVGGVIVDTDFNLNTGNINFNFGSNNGNRPTGGGSESGDYTGVDEEPPNTGTPGERLPTDRPPEGERRIIGVIVSSTSVSSQNRLTTIFQQGNPNIFAPSLGHVNFLCRIGEGNIAAWTEDIKVKNRRHLIPCPWRQGAVDVKGTPNAGIAFTLTPIYDEVQSQVQ